MNTYDYKIIRSDRKTVALTVQEDATVLVRAPKYMSVLAIDDFVSRYADWIDKHVLKAREKTPLTDSDKDELRARAKAYIPQRVAYYADIMGLSPTGVKITSAERSFGSCSAKNSLCFSYRLMQYPSEAIDYVVVHELAHIRHKNHGADFYAEIEKILPDHKARRALLRK